MRIEQCAGSDGPRLGLVEDAEDAHLSPENDRLRSRSTWSRLRPRQAGASSLTMAGAAETRAS